MTRHRISVSFDEKSFFWVVIDNGKFIRNPTEKDLEGTKLRYYNRTNICPMCREEKSRLIELTDKSILYPKNAYHDVNKEGNQIEMYVCRLHYNRSYERYDTNSTNNLMKSLRDRRIGNLKDPCSIFADNCQKCTCIWLKVIDLNKENDNYTSPIDHSRHPILGVIQTKGRHYNSAYGEWNTDIRNEHNKKFDVLIFYCANEDGNIIERIYIFPKKELIKIKSIKIYKNSTRGTSYEKYRITDKEELKKVNEIWKDIVKYNLEKVTQCHQQELLK